MRIRPAAKAENMVQILNFDPVLQGRRAAAREQFDPPRARHDRTTQTAPDDSFSYWPVVSSGLWVSQEPSAPDPANAPERVLTEVFLILGGAGLLVMLTTMFFGAPH
jgi:hypothetical protein